MVAEYCNDVGFACCMSRSPGGSLLELMGTESKRRSSVVWSEVGSAKFNSAIPWITSSLGSCDRSESSVRGLSDSTTCKTKDTVVIT